MLKRSFYTPEEVAEYYGVHPDTIRKMCREGKIPGARQFGRRWRIPASFLEENQSVDTSGDQPSNESTQ